MVDESVLAGVERRSHTGFNRFRRFINDYWILPLLFCYLQLATQAFYVADTPLDRLSKGNQAFFKGIPIAYEIATNDFPNTLIGHFYEIGIQSFYDADLFQTNHNELKLALSSPEMKESIYQKMIESRKHHESEIGGILSISYADDGPKLHLNEITSLNEIYLIKLRKTVDSPSDFLELLQAEKHQQTLEGVGMQKRWIDQLVSLIKNERITGHRQRLLLQNFIEMFEALSDSRYLLSPYQLKAGLGKIPFNQHYVGLFHFHNGLNEPPSPVDTQQSMRKRQIVMTFSEEGWTLYDVAKRDLSKIDISMSEANQFLPF